MTVRRVGENDVRELAHELRAVHATTGAPVPVSAEFVDEPPGGWALRVAARSVVVVTRSGRAAAPAAPLRVRLAAGGADRLAAPEAVVTLTAATAEHAFAPADAELEVLLVKNDQKPATGATVKAHPTGTGTALTLTEHPGGVYRSGARAWTKAFHPLEIRVGSVKRRLVIDPTSRVTRVRLVVPT